MSENSNPDAESSTPSGTSEPASTAGATRLTADSTVASTADSTADSTAGSTSSTTGSTAAPESAPAAAPGRTGASAATETSSDTTRKSPRMAVSLATVRTKIAQLVWLVCVVFALILAAGALLIALQGAGTNASNSLFEWVVNTGDKLDFGVFGRENGLFDFVGKNSDTKDALANWGLAAIAWLVIGKILDRIIRP